MFKTDLILYDFELENVIFFSLIMTYVVYIV